MLMSFYPPAIISTSSFQARAKSLLQFLQTHLTAVLLFPTGTVYAIKAAEKSSVLSRISPAKNRRRPTAMNFSLLLETVSHTLKRAVGVHIPAHSVFRDGAAA